MHLACDKSKYNDFCTRNILPHEMADDLIDNVAVVSLS
jgi:hypothetical protein